MKIAKDFKFTVEILAHFSPLCAFLNAGTLES